MSGQFIRITPFMHVDDVGRAVAFFERLGFKQYVRHTDYAYVQRECAGVRIMQNKNDDGAPPGNRRFCYYVDVEDIEALYQELKPVLDAMPPRDVHGPADKPYGQRELCILAPDGNLLVFGQAIEG